MLDTEAVSFGRINNSYTCRFGNLEALPEIKSRRVRLVAVADAAAIAAIYAPIVAATAISFEEVPPDTAEMQRRIAASAADFPWLVAEIDAELIGFAYASPHRVRSAYRWSVDVSVYVAER
ncbi:MAG: GNAT family N-acetyltransferase, partial [Candidatus Eremiobacteraeota bacterium]|nr:GNAT family N-acetyltransferase [Candidatus Eremiobacteraeota bacterium]